MLGGLTALVMGSALATKPGVGLAYRPAAVVTRDPVSLRDLADLRALPAHLRARAGDLAIGPAPRPGHAAELSIARLNTRLRALMPALSPWLVDQPDQGILLVREPAAAPEPSRAAMRCVVVQRPLKADAVPTDLDLATTACRATAAPNRLRYDGGLGVVRARQDLAVGDVVRAPPADMLASVAPGDALLVEAQVGSVRVRREVEAVQAARAGKPVFVHGGDNTVFSAPALETNP